jgi:hypothetical protein
VEKVTYVPCRLECGESVGELTSEMKGRSERKRS